MLNKKGKWEWDYNSQIIHSKNDTMRTTQKTVAELFGKNIKTISKHLTNIFESGKLVKLEVTFNPNDYTND